jgi:hypothetical protein
MMAIFADDTALLSNHENPNLASEQLQHHLSLLQTRRNRWHMKANQCRLVFHLQGTRHIPYPMSSWRMLSVPTKAEAKYLNQRCNMAQAHEDKNATAEPQLQQM